MISKYLKNDKENLNNYHIKSLLDSLFWLIKIFNTFVTSSLIWIIKIAKFTKIFFVFSCIFMYQTAYAYQYPFNRAVIPALITADNFLSNAAVKAKRRYQDNAGNNMAVYQTMQGFEELIDDNVENYAGILSLRLLDDYRIILQFMPNHPVLDLRNINIVLVPSFNLNDLNITKYSCYTDFDKNLRPFFHGGLTATIDGDLSLFTKFLNSKSIREITGCVYVSSNSQMSIIYHY